MASSSTVHAIDPLLPAAHISVIRDSIREWNRKADYLLEDLERPQKDIRFWDNFESGCKVIGGGLMVAGAGLSLVPRLAFPIWLWGGGVLLNKFIAPKYRRSHVARNMEEVNRILIDFANYTDNLANNLENREEMRACSRHVVRILKDITQLARRDFGDCCLYPSDMFMMEDVIGVLLSFSFPTRAVDAAATTGVAASATTVANSTQLKEINLVDSSQLVKHIAHIYVILKGALEIIDGICVLCQTSANDNNFQNLKTQLARRKESLGEAANNLERTIMQDRHYPN